MEKRFVLYAYDEAEDLNKPESFYNDYETLQEMIDDAKSVFREYEYISMFDRENKEWIQVEEHGFFRQ